MKVDQFDFDLPQDRIALRPARPRDASRLLHIGDQLADHRFSDLLNLVAPGDVLVFNDTKVIPARLAGRRGQANIEITLHMREGASSWRAFARPAKRLRPGDLIEFADTLSATVVSRGEGGEVVLAFDESGPSLDEAIARVGVMPLPPYIARRRSIDQSDMEDYQTTYAKAPGAVAAPTAGLHFTPDMMKALGQKGVESVFATLHVGAGTFLPVKSEDTDDHAMHTELCHLGKVAVDKINECRAKGGRVTAVGTTALRTLESAASDDGKVCEIDGPTDLFILPGYRFKIVDRLITNFHLPRSTLFMLICAFAGIERAYAAYEHAIKQGYRFYSYGDSCLIEPGSKQ